MRSQGVFHPNLTTYQWWVVKQKVMDNGFLGCSDNVAQAAPIGVCAGNDFSLRVRLLREGAPLVFLEGAAEDGKPLAPSVSAVGPTGRRYALAVSASDAAKGELVADVPGDLLAPGASYGLEVRGWRGSVSKPRAWRSYLERLVRITAGAAPDTHAGAVVSGDAFEVGMEVQAVGEPWGDSEVDVEKVITTECEALNGQSVAVALQAQRQRTSFLERDYGKIDSLGRMVRAEPPERELQDHRLGGFAVRIGDHLGRLSNTLSQIIGCGQGPGQVYEPPQGVTGADPASFEIAQPIADGGPSLKEQITALQSGLDGVSSLPAMCLLTESEYAGLAEKDPGVLYVVKA